MQDNINNRILKYLEKNYKKKIILNQLGFIESQFVFENFSYNLEEDILKFEDDITIFLDNDTQIKLSI